MDEHGVLDRLRNLDSGGRAALRREAGKCMAEASAQGLSEFCRITPAGMNRRHQECWFAVMAIACLWNIEEAHVGGDFPALLQRYARKQESGGMDRRIRSLLDTRWEEDGYLTSKLSRLARMLRSDDRNVMPDADQLLNDLLHWNSDSRYVQLRWAQCFYQQNNSDTKTEDE